MCSYQAYAGRSALSGRRHSTYLRVPLNYPLRLPATEHRTTEQLAVPYSLPPTPGQRGEGAAAVPAACCWYVSARRVNFLPTAHKPPSRRPGVFGRADHAPVRAPLAVCRHSRQSNQNVQGMRSRPRFGLVSARGRARRDQCTTCLASADPRPGSLPSV